MGKVSELPVATVVTANSVVYMLDGGLSKQITAPNFGNTLPVTATGDLTPRALADYLGDISGGSVLDRDVTTNSIVSTTTETDLYSFTVPADTLGTNSIIKVSIFGEVLNNSGLLRNFVWRVKYGATTLFDSTSATSDTNSGADTRAFELSLTLMGGGATSSQKLTGRHLLSENSTPTAGIGSMTGIDSASGTFKGSSSEDSTAAKTFVVTVQPEVSDANFSVTADIRLAETVT